MAKFGSRLAAVVLLSTLVGVGHAAAQGRPAVSGAIVEVRVPSLTRVTVVESQTPSGLPTLVVESNDPAIRAEYQRRQGNGVLVPSTSEGTSPRGERALLFTFAAP